jgi:ferredoxin
LKLKESTKAFIGEARGVKGFSFFDLLHGYFYARWTYFYIAMGSGEHPLAKRLRPLVIWIGKRLVSIANAPDQSNRVRFEDTYHGKVLPLAAATRLVSVKEDICLGDLEQVIPYQKAREIILKNPDHIVVIDCPCRAAREHPCLPMDVCLIVGEPFASFVIEHQPKRSRWITSQQAQQILEAEDQRGHVHHAFFKDSMLDRFYAICNCCNCCCAALYAQRNGTPMLASSGYVARVDENLCLNCGQCEQACNFDAMHVNLRAEVDKDKCMGCGLCVNQCQPGAIQLMRMESKGKPLEIQELIEAFRKSEAENKSRSAINAN